MASISEPVVIAKYSKWVQLLLGLLCMAAISSPQYVWTLLTKPMIAKLGVGLAELQVTFSLLIILQTFFSPFRVSPPNAPRAPLKVDSLLDIAGGPFSAAGCKSPRMYRVFSKIYMRARRHHRRGSGKGARSPFE